MTPRLLSATVVLGMALTAPLAAASPDTFPSFTVAKAHALVDSEVAVAVEDTSAITNDTWRDPWRIVGIVLTGDGPTPRPGILFVYDPGRRRFVRSSDLHGYTSDQRYEEPFALTIHAATRHLRAGALDADGSSLSEKAAAAVARFRAATGVTEGAMVVVTLVALIAIPFGIYLIALGLVRLVDAVSLAAARHLAMWRAARTIANALRNRRSE